MFYYYQSYGLNFMTVENIDEYVNNKIIWKS